MAISTVGAATPTEASGSSLGLQDFMRILLTQLTYQDPLKPMDNQQFMAQMAQFTSLEQAQRMNDKLQQLTENQAALQSIGLIGRTVDVRTSGGSSSGTVSALSVQGAAPLLRVTLSGGTVLQDVSLADVLAVH